MCSASASLSVFSWLCCERMEKLLMLTEVGAWIVKSGCVKSVLDPMHVSLCFLILLCSLQRDVDPMYDNSHLSHTYL